MESARSHSGDVDQNNCHHYYLRTKDDDIPPVDSQDESVAEEEWEES